MEIKKITKEQDFPSLLYKLNNFENNNIIKNKDITKNINKLNFPSDLRQEQKKISNNQNNFVNENKNKQIHSGTENLQFFVDHTNRETESNYNIYNKEMKKFLNLNNTNNETNFYRIKNDKKEEKNNNISKYEKNNYNDVKNQKNLNTNILKINQKDYSEDNKANLDLVNKANWDPIKKINVKNVFEKEKIENNIYNHIYIFDKSKEELFSKVQSDTSDIDKILSDMDKKNNNINLFGKPILPNNQNFKGQFNNKANIYDPKIISDTNLDLFHIFGDCTKK